jgi:tRNA dimethylallyltransferase
MANKLIAIVGPTASGKTRLAVELSESRTAFEAINADSRQVYRHMDIGTAKPTVAEQASLRHHLIDVVDPDDPFGLASWLDLANEALAAVWACGGVPVLVGGTGQYVWALLEGWRIPEVPPNDELRRELEGRPPQELLAELRRIDPESNEFIQPQNARRVIRAIEVFQATGKPFSYWRTKEPPAFDWLAVGLRPSRDQLYARIDARVDEMVAAGFIEEVQKLREMGLGRELPSMSGIGYGEMCAHLAGEITLREALARTKVGTHRLARHQRAWFKASDQRIHWLDDAAKASEIVASFLESDDNG